MKIFSRWFGSCMHARFGWYVFVIYRQYPCEDTLRHPGGSVIAGLSLPFSNMYRVEQSE